MKKSNTKRALGMSLISLLACGIMFAGSTYAWFTDEVVASGNKIETGTLKVDLEVLEGTSWKSLRDSSEAVFSGGLWEPGYTDYAVFKVENEGNLAVKWNLKAVKVGADSKNLAEVIDVYALVSDTELANPTSLKETGYEKVGTLAKVLEDGTLLEGTFDSNTKGTAKYLGIMLHMQEEAGNEYQGATDVVFDIKLNAYQLAQEEDGFNNPNYDAEAISTVTTASQLADALSMGGNIILGADITIQESLMVPSGKIATLDLNGRKLTTSYDASAEKHLYAIENYGSLTIQDRTENGKIAARGIYNYGELTLNSGTIEAIDGNGGYAVQSKAGSKFIMNGGKIAATNEDDHLVNNGGYDATTVMIASGAEFTLNGGEIVNDNDWTYAIDNRGTTSITGGKVTSIHSTLGNYGVMNISGGEFTCNGLDGVTAHALIAWNNSNTLITGGIFDGKDNYNGFDIDSTAGANVTINGGTFLHAHSGALYGDGNYEVNGGKFEGWNPAKDYLSTGYAVKPSTVDGVEWYTVTAITEDIVLSNNEIIYLGGDHGAITVDGEGTLVLSNVSVNAANAHALTVLSSDVKVEIENNVVLEGSAGYSGIYVPENVTLDLSGTGYLTAIGSDGADSANGGHGIGGLGNINIHDLAKLTAKGYGIHAFGIGGASKEITITNTNIETVQGGYVQPNFINDTKYGKSEPEGGAAIGSSTDGAVITLKNSTVKNALGGSKSAAIGATYWTGVSINIDECTISYAQGGNASAAIGGSRVASDATRVDDIVININNSTIKAVGGEFAAGIGSGYDTHCTAYSANTPITTINITGTSVITAQGGKYGAGIGTGYHTAGLAGNIESTVVINATAGESREKYTIAQAVGFGVVDTTREGKDNPSSITYNGTVIVIPEAQ